MRLLFISGVFPVKNVHYLIYEFIYLKLYANYHNLYNKNYIHNKLIQKLYYRLIYNKTLYSLRTYHIYHQKQPLPYFLLLKLCIQI